MFYADEPGQIRIILGIKDILAQCITASSLTWGDSTIGPKEKAVG